jgi:hypothetical protein
MEHEVFIPSNGEMFYAWDVRLTVLEQRRESCPCTFHERDGTVRKGKMYYTLELGKVSFRASPGTVAVGHQGQLSSTNDQFYDVTVSSLQSEEEHVLVSGEARENLTMGEIANHRRQRTPRFRSVCILWQWRGAAAAEH